ncbi:hypothetical protein D2E51_16195 [Mycobacteroides abscessus]|nr:hypothetical protein [Mycobacteroides abscessus]AIC72951.1 hypothetical protein MYCMA_12865 [Mycobacteroides abscessus subsp. massiliense str. GO 06]AMU28605.1 hypothetical protein A3N96_03170 [Mycobacteroides abscessus]AMU38225.1 hypothetical protein A3N98_02635 [Mycobacteroides abscessus]AMU43277.1 hypothetical protein A3N99_02965 [Mycobacteroides abscessus]AMU63305.1 hypothetical protein A3O03_03165 [Mycobacteroides abscessus]
MVMKDRWTMPAGLRRASALVAIVALVIGGAKIVDVYTLPGSGFSTVATVAADPTGPPGPTGGMDGGMNGSQFQPPQMPSSMPDYQGGNNQPPLDQNSGISIYNTGSPGVQQVPGQQGGQQAQQGWDQPAHGTQIPDYQTNPGYTQGPGKPNPDFQAPQEQAPQQGQQPQQGDTNQAAQQPSQEREPSQVDQQDRQIQQQCELQAEDLGLLEEFLSFVGEALGGAGDVFKKPERKFAPAPQCGICGKPMLPQRPAPQSPAPPTPPAPVPFNNYTPKTWGACPVDGSKETKVVATFLRSGMSSTLGSGVSTLYCGTSGYGLNHLYARHHDQDWQNKSFEGGNPGNWRYLADYAIAAVLAYPQGAVYQPGNNTWMYYRQVDLITADGKVIPGHSFWARVVVSNSDGKIITAFPSSSPPIK